MAFSFQPILEVYLIPKIFLGQSSHSINILLCCRAGGLPCPPYSSNSYLKGRKEFLCDSPMAPNTYFRYGKYSTGCPVSDSEPLPQPPLNAMLKTYLYVLVLASFLFITNLNSSHNNLSPLQIPFVIHCCKNGPNHSLTCIHASLQCGFPSSLIKR